LADQATDTASAALLKLIAEWRAEAAASLERWPRGAILTSKKLRACADQLEAELERAEGARGGRVVPGPITQGEWFLTEQRSDHDCYTTERRISARRAGHYEERFIGRVYEQQDAEFIVAAANAALASLPAPVAPCGAKHDSTQAVCELPVGHTQNHRGPFAHGTAQWPAPAVPDGLRATLQAFVDRERALLGPRTGQSVGYQPSITPSVLKALEAMLASAPAAPEKPPE